MICNQFGSLGKYTESLMWILGSVEVVWGIGNQLEMSARRCTTAIFTGFEFELMDDEIRVAKEKLGTSCWPACIGTCNRIMTLLTGWPVGGNEETYIDGLDANDIQTDTATQPVWAIAVFRGMILNLIPLWMERYKCDSSLQQFDFWSSWCRGFRFHFTRGMFSEVDVRFASSFHALCSRHVDPQELLHLADSSPMHGRNVVPVAANNTPTTFCNVNYVQKKWVLNKMTDELSINKIKSDVI